MQLHFKSFGQGEPIVILHGLFGMLDNWQSVAKVLAENYSVFLVDQRNHGRSPHDPLFNYHLLAEDLREFLESQWIYKCHLIGHSMGGKTVMQFALDYPDMVDHLVVVDIGPGANSRNHDEILEALLALPVDEIQSRQEAEDFLATLLPDYGVRQFLLKNLTRKKEGNYQWKMNLQVLNREYEAILAEIKGDHPFDGPSLFVKGAKSDYLDADHFSAVQQLFSAARLVTIPEAGHWVHADQPQRLLEEVGRFLSNH